MATGVEKLKLKLLVDKTDGRILYAESDKRFVDLIFSLLGLPLASIVQLLSSLKSGSGRSISSPSQADAQAQVGCLNNVYQSLEKLQPEFMLSPKCKTELMNPNLQPDAHARDILLNMIGRSTITETGTSLSEHETISWQNSGFRRSRSRSSFRSSSSSSFSSSFSFRFSSIPISSSSSRSGSMLGGYVRDAVPFMITDDLHVSPVSTISSITLLQKYNLTNLAQVEERWVSVGLDETVQLLRAMLVSNTPLTDVFGGTEKVKQATTSTAKPEASH